MKKPTPMMKDEDASPNDVDDKLIAKRKRLVMMVSGGGMGMNGPPPSNGKTKVPLS